MIHRKLGYHKGGPKNTSGDRNEERGREPSPSHSWLVDGGHRWEVAIRCHRVTSNAREWDTYCRLR
jgi:hypothetical protein